MTISYTLQPQPIWIFNDLLGRPAAGGKLYTKSSLNPTQFKNVYQDAAGNIPWNNPIVFDEDGMAPGSIYWILDTDNPQDLYYVYFEDAEGNLIWSENVYPISGSGGGGGGVTIVEKIVNLVTNSSFTNNVGTTVTSPVANNTLLAPGAHSGLIFPDITFIRDGTLSGTDTISFVPFTSDPGIGINPISPDFLTPYYMRYVCTVGGGENYKGIQIPISKYVNNLSSKILTLTFYARKTAGAGNQLNFFLYQYFGSGGSPSIVAPVDLVQPKNLTGSFDFYTVNITIPSTLGKTLGNSDDDATYLQIRYPTGSTDTIDIFKPMIFVGSVYPTVIYEDNEENELKMQLQRTGDVKSSMNAFSNNASSLFQNGWIPLNDGTIGNASSGANTRAKPDTWLLYKLIWENTVNADCPVSTGRGSNALADWNANKTIQLPSTVGRVLADRGTDTNALGHAFGSDTATLIASNLPPHSHSVAIPASQNDGLLGSARSGGGIPNTPISLNTGNGPGSSSPFSIQQKTVYYNMLIKL